MPHSRLPMPGRKAALRAWGEAKRREEQTGLSRWPFQAPNWTEERMGRVRLWSSLAASAVYSASR